MQGNSLCIRLLFWEGGVVLILQNWEPGDYSGTRKGCPVLRAGHIPLPVQLPTIRCPWGSRMPDPWSTWTSFLVEMGGHMKNVQQKRWPMVKNRKWQILPVPFHFLGKKREAIEIFWSDILRWRSTRNPIRRCHPRWKECPRRFLL